MKIIIDENIPYSYLFKRMGEVKSISGRWISRSDVGDADALIIRSVTQVDKTLLEGTSVKFVGTVTSGTDHINETWLKKAGIKFSSAPGSNAIAVVEYVFSALLALAERDGFLLRDRILGIVGVGNIGRLLQKRLNALEIHTLLCDPPRADRGEIENSIPLRTLVEQADILTFHTPLIKSGPYKTFHLVNQELIENLRPGSILINTCRGSVIDNSALLTCLEAGQNLSVVLDVWEKEPEFNAALLRKIDIGTPHIAGYTVEGKARATIQIFKSYSDFIGKSQHISLNSILSTPKIDSVNLHGTFDEITLKRLAHFIYDIRRDDFIFRKIAGSPGGFDKLHKNYFERWEWSSLSITCDNDNTRALLRKLGFNLIKN